MYLLLRLGIEIPGAEGTGDGELVFNRYRDLVWEDEQVLEMDGGDACTTV